MNTGISHILNAEVKKIEKILKISEDVENILKINESVSKMCDTISKFTAMTSTTESMFKKCLDCSNDL